MRFLIFVFLLAPLHVNAKVVAKYTFDNRVAATAPEPAQDAESILAKKRVTSYLPAKDNGEVGPALAFVDLKHAGGQPLFYDPIERGGSLVLRGAQMLAAETSIPVGENVTFELGTNYDYITQVWYTPILLDIQRGSTRLCIRFVEPNQAKGTWKLQFVQDDKAIFTSSEMDFKTWYKIRLELKSQTFVLHVNDRVVTTHDFTKPIAGELLFGIGGVLDPQKRVQRGSHTILIDGITITEP